MSLRSIMTTPVVTVDMDDTLVVVNDIFTQARFHHVLVVEVGILCGVISDRDLLKVLSPKLGTVAATNADFATLNKKAHQIMSRNLIVLNQTDSIYTAIDVFQAHRISCIPIVDETFKPIGIVSWRDIFKAIKK